MDLLCKNLYLKKTHLFKNNSRLANRCWIHYIQQYNNCYYYVRKYLQLHASKLYYITDANKVMDMNKAHEPVVRKGGFGTKPRGDDVYDGSNIDFSVALARYTDRKNDHLIEIQSAVLYPPLHHHHGWWKRSYLLNAHHWRTLLYHSYRLDVLSLRSRYVRYSPLTNFMQFVLLQGHDQD